MKNRRHGERFHLMVAVLALTLAGCPCDGEEVCGDDWSGVAPADLPAIELPEVVVTGSNDAPFAELPEVVVIGSNDASPAQLPEVVVIGSKDPSPVSDEQPGGDEDPQPAPFNDLVDVPCVRNVLACNACDADFQSCLGPYQIAYFRCRMDQSVDEATCDSIGDTASDQCVPSYVACMQPTRPVIAQKGLLN